MVIGGINMKDRIADFLGSETVFVIVIVIMIVVPILGSILLNYII